MAGVYDALSRGVESGFSMGRQAAQDEETKRARKVQEERQAAEDVRRAETHELDAQRTRFGLEQAQTTAARQEETRHAAVLEGEAAEIEKTQAARQAQGLPLDEGAAQRYAEIKSGLARRNQAALDFFSRAKVGQIDPMEVSGPELRMNLTAATGMLPEELPMVRAGAADIEAGMETQNWGLVTQGVNKAMIGQLKRGIGTPSPYGGTITRKEIIGLDPAIDAAGNEHPNRFIPRLRVYVEGVSPTGGEMYYDAPMTQNGSTEETDKVVAIDIKKGMDWLANVKMLAEMAERPDVKAKLEPGPNDEAKRFIEQLRTLTAPQAKKPDYKVVPAGSGILDERTGKFVREPAATAPKRIEQKNADGTITTLEWDGQQYVPVAGTERAPRAVKAGGGGAGGGGVTGTGVKVGADDPKAVDFWALSALAGDNTWQTNLGRSKEGARMVAAVRSRIPQLAAQLGLHPADVGTTRAQRVALDVTLKELTKRAEAIQLFSSKTEKDMATFEEIARELQRTNPTIIAKPINAVRRALSDTDQARLDLAARQMATEYERLINGGALSVAQLPVAARLDAAKLINGDMPLDQALATTRVMRQEMANAKAAANESRTRVTEQLRSLGRWDLGGGGTPAAPGAAPAPAPAAAGNLPQRPAGVAPSAKYSPSRKEWWDRDASGQLVKVWPK